VSLLLCPSWPVVLFFYVSMPRGLSAGKRSPLASIGYDGKPYRSPDFLNVMGPPDEIFYRVA
jgi:hypothetical protein